MQQTRLENAKLVNTGGVLRVVDDSGDVAGGSGEAAGDALGTAISTHPVNLRPVLNGSSIVSLGYTCPTGPVLPALTSLTDYGLLSRPNILMACDAWVFNGRTAIIK